MPRKKDQDARKRQLVDAAFATLARRGSEATRISDIAREAGVATGLVHYYFPSKDDLLLEATRREIDTFYESIVRELEPIDDPGERLIAAVRYTLPDDGSDPGWVVLFQFWSRAMYSRPLATLSVMFRERALRMFMDILQDGQERGAFELSSDARSVATTLMALIDGLSFQIVLKDPAVNVAGMERLLLDYLRDAAGVKEPA